MPRFEKTSRRRPNQGPCAAAYRDNSAWKFELRSRAQKTQDPSNKKTINHTLTTSRALSLVESGEDLRSPSQTQKPLPRPRQIQCACSAVGSPPKETQKFHPNNHGRSDACNTPRRRLPMRYVYQSLLLTLFEHALTVFARRHRKHLLQTRPCACSASPPSRANCPPGIG